MQIPLVSFLVILLQDATPSQARVPGQIWGGAFKPTGLNTIIRNQCITSNKGGGFFHQKGTEEGRATSKLVAEVAGPVTSRAVLQLLLKVNICMSICNCTCFVFVFVIVFALLCSQGATRRWSPALSGN